MPSIYNFRIALTNEQIDALKAVVEAGEYATTSEVVREAIRDWQFKRELRQKNIRHLRELWDEGKASGVPQAVNFTAFRTEARQRLRNSNHLKRTADPSTAFGAKRAKLHSG